MDPEKLWHSLVRDPAKREIVDAVILFVDVMNSATISDILSLKEYDQFLTEFQMIAGRTIAENVRDYSAPADRLRDCSIRGDEACLILYSGDRQEDIRVALVTATRMKAAFLASTANRQRLESGRSFFDLGIGIHTGRVTLGMRQLGLQCDTRSVPEVKPEGYTINLAKRVEAFSREGSFSHIMVSGEAKSLAEQAGLQIAFEPKGRVVHRGILQPTLVYEMKSPIHIEERWPARIIQGKDELQAFKQASEIDPTSLWLIMALAHYHYDQEEYASAREYYNQAINLEPSYPVSRMYLGRTLYRIANLASDPSDRKTWLEESVKELEQALRSSEFRSVATHDFLAVAYRRLGEYDKALNHHRLALGISPTSVWARNAYAYTLAESKLAGEERSLDVAANLIRILESDKRAMPEYDYIIYHTHGFIKSAMGGKRNLASAVEMYDKALKGCTRITSERKRVEKESEILYHKAVALHGCSESDSMYGQQAREAFMTLFKTAQKQKDWEPYWMADARQRSAMLALGS